MTTPIIFRFKNHLEEINVNHVREYYYSPKEESEREYYEISDIFRNAFRRWTGREELPPRIRKIRSSSHFHIGFSGYGRNFYPHSFNTEEEGWNDDTILKAEYERFDKFMKQWTPKDEV